MSYASDLFDAIKHADPAAATAALSADPAAAMARDDSGISALMTALYYRQRDIAESIACVRETLDIFEATSLGRAEEVRAFLAQPGVDLDARSPDGFTALHYAAFFGQPDLVAMLLAAGAPPDAVARNATKVQPLHSAVAARSPESVRLLLEGGAPPDATQQQGFTALQGAAHAGDLMMVKLLLDGGADPGLQNDDGKSARDLATEGGHDAVAAALTT